MAASQSGEKYAEEVLLKLKRRPDDWHLHLRQGDRMRALIDQIPNICKRAIIMPNTIPPVTTVEMAGRYREEILAAIAERQLTDPQFTFEPLMTLYLTDNTPAEEIDKAAASGFIQAVKMYPAGATTNSSSGVTDLRKCRRTLEQMAKNDLPLCIHGEVSNLQVDIFERETDFVKDTLHQVVDTHPTLRIILEHVSTADAVEFVQNSGPNIAATITPQHLLFTRNDMFMGGLRPHLFCYPVLKTDKDRAAIINAIRTNTGKFFLGTDSAPHAVSAKEFEKCAGGVFSQQIAIEAYFEAFHAAGALDKFEKFACEYGPAFYKVKLNDEREGEIHIKRYRWEVPGSYHLETGHEVKSLFAGREMSVKAFLVDPYKC